MEQSRNIGTLHFMENQMSLVMIMPIVSIFASSAQWESVLAVGGQQFAQIGNYLTIWKNLLLSVSPPKQNHSKIRKNCHAIHKFA